MLVCLNDALLDNELCCNWFARVNTMYHGAKKHIFPVLLRSAQLTRFGDANRTMELRAWVPVHPDDDASFMGGYDKLLTSIRTKV